jgi:hypothetical protein
LLGLYDRGDCCFAWLESLQCFEFVCQQWDVHCHGLVVFQSRKNKRKRTSRREAVDAVGGLMRMAFNALGVGEAVDGSEEAPLDEGGSRVVVVVVRRLGGSCRLACTTARRRLSLRLACTTARRRLSLGLYDGSEEGEYCLMLCACCFRRLAQGLSRLTTASRRCQQFGGCEDRCDARIDAMRGSMRCYYGYYDYRCDG